jgi:hypothetical protein
MHVNQKGKTERLKGKVDKKESQEKKTILTYVLLMV